MAKEVSFPNDLKRFLQKKEWAGTRGIVGFLIGQVSQRKVHVVNVWTTLTSKTDCMIAAKDACLNHLSAADDIIGLLLATTSDDANEIKNNLGALPEEIQTAIAGPQLVVCVVSSAPETPEISFYTLTQGEHNILVKVQEHAEVDRGPESAVTFRLQAQLSLQLQVNEKKTGNSELWDTKMDNAFSNLEAEVLSDSYVYGVRGTNTLFSNGATAGAKNEFSNVTKLLSFVEEEKEASGTRGKRTLRAEQVQPPVLIDVYQQVSGSIDRFARPTCAPAVHQKTGTFQSQQLTLPLDVVVDVDKNETLTTLIDHFSKGIASQLRAMKECMQQHHVGETGFHTPEPFHFGIPHRHTAITVVYPRHVPDAELEERRKELHETMCLGLVSPLFRRTNARLLDGYKTAGGYLVNPHVGLPPSGVKDGKTHLVQGNYTYHHYMQDCFDDDKWGCAYRSLQTLVSWFRLQGYTDKPVPPHKEIQQALVAVGDKESNFIGSKKWIGSFEVSFVLDHLLGVTSKFVSVSAGSDLANKGRELAQHFDTDGSPIMIGGGVLAHTILGVDYSEVSGEIKFLILDPHYTGGEDLNIIQKEGWCGWKDIHFWKPTAHYNLCMPLRPACF